jgi:hypothetical protein
VKKIIYITVLHDINGSRFITTKKKLLDQELKLFKNFNFIIAHNTTMKQFLISKGIKDPHIFILNLFDYKTNFMISMRKKNNTVVFAGNLNKSDFVKKLPALANSVNYNLYGLLDDKNYFKKNKNIIYHGTFSPDIIPQTITGAYGLVWDGDNLDTCNGENGEYLKLNTSHKISLYIVSGLPIIIWSEAAMSKFITKNNLGLSVNSLYDIEKLLSNITEKKYIEMQNSLINFSKLIKNGKNITGVVDKILMEIS